VPHGLDHRAEKSGYRLAAHGAEGASTGLKGGEAVRQIDFSDWWVAFFPHPPCQVATAAIDRFTL
jgi:hypothetical protein